MRDTAGVFSAGRQGLEMGACPGRVLSGPLSLAGWSGQDSRAEQRSRALETWSPGVCTWVPAFSNSLLRTMYVSDFNALVCKTGQRGLAPLPQRVVRI